MRSSTSVVLLAVLNLTLLGCGKKKAGDAGGAGGAGAPANLKAFSALATVKP